MIHVLLHARVEEARRAKGHWCGWADDSASVFNVTNGVCVRAQVAMWGQCGGRSSAVGADASDTNVCCAWGGWVQG
jgi:hypothetical protein